MTRRHNIAISVTMLFLGLAAAGLCFIAYAKRIKAEDVTKNKEGLCVYPGRPAIVLGILAAILVLIEQIVVSAATGCLCCSRNKFPCNCCGIIALILFICSWLSFTITVLALVLTAIFNTSSYLRRSQNDNNFKSNSNVERRNKDGCLIGNEALFYGCALWCLINLAFSLICYAMYLYGVKRSHKRHEVGNFSHV